MMPAPENTPDKAVCNPARRGDRIGYPVRRDIGSGCMLAHGDLRGTFPSGGRIQAG
jgi:hypothetical protein